MFVQKQQTEGFQKYLPAKPFQFIFFLFFYAMLPEKSLQNMSRRTMLKHYSFNDDMF